MSRDIVHQFPENKWTIQDKLVQLRNVIKLQDRATVQSELRALVKCKNQAKNIKKLDKENENFRATLDTNIRGDDLRRRTTMRNNRSYQLAYQRLPTEKIVEMISQVLFNKVRELDRLRYERREMEKTLMTLKLQLQELKHAKKFVLKTWKEQEVSNKVQNMIVKQNAARTVTETYEKMIKILKEDAQKFDKILADLKTDKLIQSKCILKATEMGQTATEELGNLREEYKIEEKNILTVMKTMDMTAKTIKADLDKVTSSCRTVVRTESITRFGSIQVDDDDEEHDEEVQTYFLTKELAELEDGLQKLQSACEVLTFDEIYPRIEQQVYQRVRILRQLQLKESMRDHLLDQRNKLDALLESLVHTMVPTTEWYREEKARLISEAQQIDQEHAKTEAAKEKTGALLLDIRMGLLSLSRKLDRIDTSSKYDLLATALDDNSPEGVYSTLPMPETDAMEVLGNVNRKMEMLVNQIKSIEFSLTPDTYLKSRRAFEFKIISNNVIKRKVDEYELAMTQMLEELGATDDPLVPTRQDIKNRSARIVDIFGTERHEPEQKRGRLFKRKRYV